MCGIIGYLGRRDATPVLIDGLRCLEYRGYDSAGIAVLDRSTGSSTMTKSESKVALLVERLKDGMPSGHLGIGHTRWATHGKPSLANAHPHSDCSGRIVVVHNGIIENFAELKLELEGRGHRFVSETDTEVVPHLIEDCYRGDFLEAVRVALRQIKGAYALAIFSLDNPDLLVGARLNAPLVVGLNGDEFFVASDITAVIPYTKKVLVLGEGELVAITPLGARVSTLEGIAVASKVIHVDWDVSQAQKGGYRHFMLKEIHETPDAVANALRGRLRANGSVPFQVSAMSDADLRRYRDVLLLGMGTSLHAAMVGEYLIEDWAGIPARAADASEFRYRRPTIGAETLTLVLTQSGETADSIVAMRHAHERGSHTLAITNVVSSTAARDGDEAIYLHAGPEIGVASSKTFLSHLITLYLLAIRLASAHGRMPLERRQELAAVLRGLPDAVRIVLSREDEIARLAGRYCSFKNFMFLGRGISYPIALEGALKLKEVSYVHAEGTSAGALKHGPIALLDQDFPVIAICTDSTTREKVAGNVHEVAARGAPVLALVTEGDHSLDRIVTDRIEIPAGDEAAAAVLTTVVLQLFAYHMAILLGRDVDQPRNLAKSVTVE
ncbi:MAG: glutamine--fructose-6-phosphate transaminase (isomerizing) [Candidatus Dormibacteria bacterium]